MAVKKEPWISVEFTSGQVVNFNYYHIATVVISRDSTPETEISEAEITLTNGKVWKFLGEHAIWFEYQWKKIVNKEND